jgi:predicted Holliday junction resolvase-like endonuclease
MDNTNLWIFLAIITFIVIVVSILAMAIGYFWASSKTKSSLLQQNEVVFRRAQEQLQSWKDQELISARQQIFDAAKGLAIQEMQEKVQQWQQSELLSIRKQMSEAIRGEMIQEAQQQLIKWRSGELENSKRQIWDVLSKEAANTLAQWKVETEKEIRQDAIGKSQSVTIGKMTEHIVPYLPGFRFNPADARFIGSPIDFVVFDGLSDDSVKKIVFVEIKTGSSNLSTRERSVRNAVQDRNIEWLEVKVNLENPEVIQEYKSRRNNKKNEGINDNP